MAANVGLGASSGITAVRIFMQPLMKKGVLACLGLLLPVYSLFAQSPQEPVSTTPQAVPTAPAPKSPSCIADPQSDQTATATIRGAIIDVKGAPVVGAQVILKREDQTPEQKTLTNDDGQYFFLDIPPGPFHLTITAAGFKGQSTSGTLKPGENCALPQINLVVETNVTEVKVELTPIELAQEQVADQEKQRLLGVIPNFYVSYVPDAAPLNSKQKFQLAWKSMVDPVTFGVTGAIAGVQQATNSFSGYGQGAQGYGKRFGATYADLVTSTVIGGAILPSVLKQDPRYFYKGTGSVRSRLLYAIGNAVICKGDNGHWQPNYSGILGGLAAGGLSNLYYPASDRNGVGLTFENALVGIGGGAAINILQEFLLRKLTPNLPSSATP